MHIHSSDATNTDWLFSIHGDFPPFLLPHRLMVHNSPCEIRFGFIPLGIYTCTTVSADATCPGWDTPNALTPKALQKVDHVDHSGRGEKPDVKRERSRMQGEAAARKPLICRAIARNGICPVRSRGNPLPIQRRSENRQTWMRLDSRSKSGD